MEKREPSMVEHSQTPAARACMGYKYIINAKIDQRLDRWNYINQCFGGNLPQVASCCLKAKWWFDNTATEGRNSSLSWVCLQTVMFSWPWPPYWSSLVHDLQADQSWVMMCRGWRGVIMWHISDSRCRASKKPGWGQQRSWNWHCDTFCKSNFTAWVLSYSKGSLASGQGTWAWSWLATHILIIIELSLIATYLL